MSRPSILFRATKKLLRLQAKVSCKFVVPFGRDLAPDRWIFVIGCYNSGTTLLAEVLSSHEQIGGLPHEGQYFTDRLPYAAQFGWPRMWIRCLDRVRLEPEDIDERTIRRIKRQWSIYSPRDTKNLMEKSIANATRTPFLQAHFQPAYFIVITRNGYAVAEGIRRRASPGRWGNREYPDGYPIGLCAEQWCGSVELLDRDRPALDRVIDVTYEELTADPAGTLGRLTDFLGVDSFPEALLHGTWPVADRDEPIRNMNEQALKRLSEKDLEEIEAVAGEQLARHGYERQPAT